MKLIKSNRFIFTLDKYPNIILSIILWSVQSRLNSVKLDRGGVSGAQFVDCAVQGL